MRRPQPARRAHGPRPGRRASALLAPPLVAAMLVSACTATDGGTSDADTAAPGTDSYPAVADQIAEYAETVAEETQVPAVAIGIITPDGLSEGRYLGVNDAGDPVTADTVFEIGSATKAFLGVTQAMLVDRGELSWDDRVIDHHPDFRLYDPWVTREFRIADLIAQRTGMPEYAADEMFDFGFPWADNVPAMADVEPESSFRHQFAYQNNPHYVAGEIVADKVGADDWNAAVAEMIFEPLGMTGTATGTTALVDATDTTRGHTIRDGQLREQPLADFPSVSQGAGSIVSNIHDMGTWVSMHLSGGEGPNGRLLSRAQLDETYRSRVTIDDAYFAELVGVGPGEPDLDYATGWVLQSLPEGRVVSHGGITMGYNASVMFDPDREVGLVVLSNQGHLGGYSIAIGKYGMDLLQGREPRDYFAETQVFHEETLASAAAATQELIDENTTAEHPLGWYEGVYEHPRLGRLNFRADGDVLRTELGPRDFEATATRLAGSIFTLGWRIEGDPEAGLHEKVATFDDTGDRPDQVDVGGLEFDRVPAAGDPAP